MIKKLALSFFTIFVVLWLSGLVLFAWQINHFSTPENEKTDAIIVLTGGRNRITEAVKLYEAGKGSRLFISGVDKDISLNNIVSTQQVNLSNFNNVDLGHDASNTVENAQETRDWVNKNNIKSIRLVTSNYHILRSLLEFREFNPQLKIIIHPVYSENIEKKWWTSWQTFSLIFKEYNKLICAYLRCFIR